MIEAPTTSREEGRASTPTRRRTVWTAAGVLGLAILTLSIVFSRDADATPLIEDLARNESAVSTSDSSIADPLKQIRSFDVMAPLAENLPLRLALRGTLGDLTPGKHTTLFFHSHRHYTGALTDFAVRTLIDAGKADALEHRLAPATLDTLREHLAEYDEALRDFAILIRSEEATAKEQLRVRGERCFEFHAKPREIDPEYPRFHRAQPLASEGTIWSEPLQPNGERVLVALWSEWPGLQTLYKDRTAMIVDRGQRVGRWVAAEFRVHGLKIFQP